MEELADFSRRPAGSHNLGLTPLEPAYRGLIRTVTALTALPVFFAAAAADAALSAEGFTRPGVILLPVLLFLLFVITVLPGRRWRRWGYDMDSERLRIVRGFLFFADTVVPLNRVQHIDVTRGPLERLFGVATLVVHTAGTHNSMVALPGLAPDTADAMREAIRDQIRRETL